MSLYYVFEQTLLQIFLINYNCVKLLIFIGTSLHRENTKQREIFVIKLGLDSQLIHHFSTFALEVRIFEIKVIITAGHNHSI